jgi:hypothetical protein
MLIAIGLCIGYLIWGRQTVTIVEKRAPMVWHDDGSLTAQRDPGAKPDLPEPSHPEGGKLIRTIELTVKPTQNKPPAVAENAVTDWSGEVASENTCAPVSVRIDLREYLDGIRASIVAKDGEVLDAVDIPHGALVRPVVRVWAVGVEKRDGETLLAVDRDVGRLRLGMSVGDDTRALRALLTF